MSLLGLEKDPSFEKLFDEEKKELRSVLKKFATEKSKNWEEKGKPLILVPLIYSVLNESGEYEDKIISVSLDDLYSTDQWQDKDWSTYVQPD